MLNKM
jgi:hypothetical protein